MWYGVLICSTRIFAAEVSISTLKSLSVTKQQLVPTLGSVIPYLEISSKQEYLVQRIAGQYSLRVCSIPTWRGNGGSGISSELHKIEIVWNMLIQFQQRTEVTGESRILSKLLTCKPTQSIFARRPGQGRLRTRVPLERGRRLQGKALGGPPADGRRGE